MLKAFFTFQKSLVLICCQIAWLLLKDSAIVMPIHLLQSSTLISVDGSVAYVTISTVRLRRVIMYS